MFSRTSTSIFYKVVELCKGDTFIGIASYISKKSALCPVASCLPRRPDVPGAYNVNSSSGCFRPGSFCPGATFFRPDAPGAPVRREPISKSCEITQADNLNRRRRLSRKAQ